MNRTEPVEILPAVDNTCDVHGTATVRLTVRILQLISFRKGTGLPILICNDCLERWAKAIPRTP